MMFRFDSAIDVPATSDASIRNNNSRRVLEEEEATEAEDETEVENSIEDNENEVQPEDVYMDCSLFRACDRCTEIEFSRILECQTGTGRIMTYRCTAATVANDETTESDPSNSLSAHTPLNGDRETRSYQEYRKDDAYYNSNNNNDNLSTIESSTTALIPSSTTIITTPAFLYHYESCLYTNDEYEFNYIQFQVFICLLGIISIYSIRKQKMFAASLFDQRRMKNTTTTSSAASTNTTITSSTSNVSRTNSNTSGRGIVIQRSNTGLMNSQNNNSDTNNVNTSSINIEMKSLLSSGSSINDMDIV